MDKTEFVKKWGSKHWLPSEWVTFDTDLDEYADEVSLRIAKKAFKGGMIFQGMDDGKDFNEWWKSNQKEGRKKI